MTNDITDYMIHRQGEKWVVYVWRGDVSDMMIADDEYSVADIIHTFANEHDEEFHKFMKEQAEKNKESEVANENINQ